MLNIYLTYKKKKKKKYHKIELKVKYVAGCVGLTRIQAKKKSNAEKSLTYFLH